MKIDISKFFESIPIKLVFTNIEMMLRNKIKEVFNENETKRYLNKIRHLIYLMSYQSSFPIGFVTSPIVSEIALRNFDLDIVKELKEIDYDIVYTRYADDMLISSKQNFDKEHVLSVVIKKLKKLGFTLNEDKIEKKDLKNEGDYIRFIGLNIVKKSESCSISTGKKFIKDLAISYVYKKRNEYEILRDKGRINYLKYCDKEGYERFKKYVDVYAKKLESDHN